MIASTQTVPKFMVNEIRLIVFASFQVSDTNFIAHFSSERQTMSSLRALYEGFTGLGVPVRSGFLYHHENDPRCDNIHLSLTETWCCC
jgi:hypothetical protein